MCILLVQHISAGPATAQGSNGHMWPVAAVLDDTGLDLSVVADS